MNDLTGETGVAGRETNRRILVIDDNAAIHDDFRKILCGDGGEANLNADEVELFGGESSSIEASDFQIDAALQGEEGLALVRKALKEERPYAMAFVDVRMPPGWDGIETVSRIWKEYPELEVVICTAYSDYSWDDMTEKLGQTDRLLILKKPFDNVEVRQLACALTAKWSLARQANGKMEELEQTVLTRTQELQDQNYDLERALGDLEKVHLQLMQADKMASIGQLAAGVAHEINNPIGFVSSNLNSLGQYVEDLKCVLAAYDGMLSECGKHDKFSARAEEVQHLRKEKDIEYVLSDVGNLLAESVEGTQRVRQIVADLRDFSHVDNPDVTEEDINSLLEKTMNVAWNELKYKTEVIKEYGDITTILCYGGKLGQVFLNLLVNAAQAIKERGTITVRTGQVGERIWIEVADTGSGIPPENLNRIFDPFFTTKEVGKGTGLGLNLAYNIVHAHGGKISVESTVGEGTTFHIELPVAGPPSAKDKEQQHDCVS